MSAHLDLVTQCKMYKLPKPVAEYRFDKKRRWKIDYAFIEYKLAIEVEGGSWLPGGGRHNRPIGFLLDLEKYNNLTLLGWSLLRFTPGMMNSGEAIEIIKEWFKEGGIKPWKSGWF